MPEVFAGTLWMTGHVEREFSWRNRVKMFKRCYECLGKDGFIHTSEFVDEPHIIPFLFNHMRWLDNDRVIHDINYMNLQLYSTGVLEQVWTVDPISIKYILRMKGNDDAPDYFYALGGSPELFNSFNPTNLDHLTSYYGFYRYLLLAKNKLGLDRVYEKHGSVETALDINYVINDIKEQINEILE